MYKRSSETHEKALSSFEIETGIEGVDIYASTLLYNLALNPKLEKEDYVIKTDWYRPDLIAKDYYGDTRYESFVILQAGSIKNLEPGKIIKLIKKSEVEKLR